MDPPDYDAIKDGMIQSLQLAGFPDVKVQFERGEGVLGITHTKPVFKMLTQSQAACPYIRPGSSVSNGTAQNPQPHERAFGTAGVVLEIVKAGSSAVVSTLVLTNRYVVRTGLKGFIPPKDEGGKKASWCPAETGSICAG